MWRYTLLPPELMPIDPGVSLVYTQGTASFNTQDYENNRRTLDPEVDPTG